MLARSLLALAALVASTTWASAYLDPGTGSLVLQMLLAGALTAAASIRIFWARIKDVTRRMLGAEPKAPPSTKP